MLSKGWEHAEAIRRKELGKSVDAHAIHIYRAIG